MTYLLVCLLFASQFVAAATKLTCSPTNKSAFRKLHDGLLKKSRNKIEPACRSSYVKVRKCCIEWDRSCNGLGIKDVQKYSKLLGALERARDRSTDKIRKLSTRKKIARFQQKVFERLSKACGSTLNRCARVCDKSTKTLASQIGKLKKQKLKLIKQRIAMVKSKSLTSSKGRKFARKVSKIQKQINSLKAKVTGTKRLANGCRASRKLPKINACYSQARGYYRQKEREILLSRASLEKNLQIRLIRKVAKKIRRKKPATRRIVTKKKRTAPRKIASKRKAPTVNWEKSKLKKKISPTVVRDRVEDKRASADLKALKQREIEHQIKKQVNQERELIAREKEWQQSRELKKTELAKGKDLGEIISESPLIVTTTLSLFFEAFYDYFFS